MNTKRFNLASRLIHWAIAFTFLYLLLTILLRLGWMNKNSVGEIISNGLAKKDVTVDKDTAGTIAKQVRRPMWETHELAGYIMIGLYVIRVIITYLQGTTFPNPFKQEGLSGKDKFRFWVYIVFYICLFGSLITAMFMEYGPDSIRHTMEELHEKSLYYMVVFIVLHIGGVLMADGGKEPGIISKMVSGDKAIA